MVDFQSRDTSRGLSDDEADDDGDDVSDGDGTEDSDGTEDGDTERAATESVDTDGVAIDSDEPDDVAAESDDTDEVAAGSDDTDDVPTESDETGDADGPDPENDASGDGAHSHGHHHGDVESLGVAVVTVSSTRSRDDDPSGDAVQRLVEADDHNVVQRDFVADDLDGIQRTLLALTAREDVDVVITTGGTGVTPDDVTIEAVEPLFDKELPGFGELFRVLSYESVGTRAIGTRTSAGISEGVPVFCLPGSEDAVRLGTEELILTEVGHLVGLTRRDE